VSGEHVLFLESNTTGTGKLAVERLLAAGSRVTFLTRSPEKYPFLEPPRPPHLVVEEVETNDLEAAAERIAAVLDRSPAQVLLTFSEYYVAHCAELASRFGFPYLAPEAARTCRDKGHLRSALRAAGKPCPPFRRLTSEAEARAAAREMELPLVVKPPGESSSKGVQRIDDEAGLVEAYGELATWRSNDRGQAIDGSVLVEGILDGPEYSVETFTLPSEGGAAPRVHTVGVTAKHLSPQPLFVEVGHDFPAPLDDERRAALVAATEGALTAVGYDFGPAHTELRWTGAGPVVVEINPRLAGGMIPELVEHALGIDLLAAYLDLLRGRRPDLAPKRRGHASIRFLLAPREGRLEAVEGVEGARRLDLVQEVSVTRRPGSAVRPAEHALDRLGYAIAAGDDPAATAAAAVAAAGAVRFSVVEPETAPAAL